MKTIKFFTFLLLACWSVTTIAENEYLPDTLWYDAGNDISIRFSLHSISEIETLTNGSDILSPSVFQVLSNNVVPNETESLSIKIDETSTNEALVLEKGTESIIILPEQIRTDSGVSLQTLKLSKKDGVVIDFYFQNLEEILEFISNRWDTEISELAQKVLIDKLMNDHKMREVKMMTIYSRNSESGIVVDEPSISRSSTNLDQLQLTAGVGISTFKKELLPNFNFRMALIFSKKGIYKNNYFADLEFMYDFVDEESKMIPKSGHFLSLGYMRNFSNTPTKADWYGLSVGYLLRKKSNIFDDDTWRISVHRKISKNIELIGQLYFPNNFGKVFPGINVKIDL